MLLNLNIIYYFALGLLNLRGCDIAYNPVFFGYIVITTTDLHLFSAIDKLPSNYEQHFKANNVNVTVSQYENVQPVLKKLVNQEKTKKVWISSTSSYALSALVPDRKLHQDVNCSIYELIYTTNCHSFYIFFHLIIY